MLKHKIFVQADYVNKIFEDDCLDIMTYLPEHSIDMVLCDLPYGTTQNKWDSIIPLDQLWKQYNRVVKPNGAIVLTSQGLFTAKLILSNERYFKYKIVWEKSKPTNFLNAKIQPLRKHEDICVFYRKLPTYNPQMGIGKAYSKGVRKNQFTGSYGNFKPVLVESESGLRYPTDIVYFKTPESEGCGTVCPKLELINSQDADEIIKAFTLLCNREAMPVVEEIQQIDRQEFDKTVLRSIGIPENVCKKIYSALLAIYNIRKSVGR